MQLLRTNRSFRLLFSATAISNLGDGVSALAFPWLASLITRDPMLIALVAFATKLPWFLFSIPVGVLVDRRDRRTLMIQADVFRFLLTTAVIALILTIPAFPPPGDPLIPILALSGLALLLGSAEVVRDNAAQTVLPAIVAKSELESANGQMWSIEHVMGSFVGPPLAGVLIAYAVPAPFVLDAVTFALAAWLVWAISIPTRAVPHKRKILTEVAEGWTWMRFNPTILRLAIMLGLINALSMLSLTILVLFSQDILQLSAVGHGVLLTAGAAGGVVGGILGPQMVAMVGAQTCVILALAMMIVPFAMIAMTTSPIVVGIALFTEMLAALLWNVVTVSYRQRRIPDALLGRVNSLYRFFGWGLMAAGAFAGGWLVSVATPTFGEKAALRVPYIIAASGSLALFLYGAAKLRL